MDNPDYKVLKKGKPVEIILDANQLKQEEYILFLNQYSRFSNREETLSEFLNSGVDFIPVKVCQTDTQGIINLHEVVYIWEKDPAPSVPIQKKLLLALRSNIEIEVEHFKNLPAYHSRMLDFLNNEGKFICFLREGSKIYINKDKIIRSTEHE